jgi:hypothetical protein
VCGSSGCVFRRFCLRCSVRVIITIDRINRKSETSLSIFDFTAGTWFSAGTLGSPCPLYTVSLEWTITSVAALNTLWHLW